MKKDFSGKPMDEGHLQLSLVESWLPPENGILAIEHRDDLMDFTGFSNYASLIESDFPLKYAVYQELRNKGLVPRPVTSSGRITGFTGILKAPKELAF